MTTPQNKNYIGLVKEMAQNEGRGLTLEDANMIEYFTVGKTFWKAMLKVEQEYNDYREYIEIIMDKGEMRELYNELKEKI